MMSTMKFPAAYHQGRNALLEFAARAACYGNSFLFVGSKSALAAAGHKLEQSFQGHSAQVLFERTSGIPCASEISRVKALAAECGARVLCAVGGGGVMDIVRAAAMELGTVLIMIPTAAASDAPCTFVSVLYSEDGSEIVGDCMFYKCPDMVYVDTAVVAAAPPRLLVSGMGDALATLYEAESCVRGGIAVSSTAMALCRTCKDLILENGRAALLAAQNNVVTPALERVIEANCFLSGVGGVNTGCAGAHGFGDFFAKLPGGHDRLHGERVAAGLVIQLILEGYPSEEVDRVIHFGLDVGMPLSVRDLGVTDIKAAAEQIGLGTECDHFVVRVNCDHSALAISGAVIAADALVEQMRKKGGELR